MRKNQVLVGVLLIASLALIVLGVMQFASRPAVVQQAQSGPTPSIVQVTRMSAEDLHKQLQSPNPPQVWDLRSSEAYTAGHIPNSQLVQFTEVAALAQKLDRKQAIVALCA